MKSCFYYVSTPKTDSPISEFVLPFGLDMIERNDLKGLREAKEIVRCIQNCFTKMEAGEYVFGFGIALPDNAEVGGWAFRMLERITVKIEDYSSNTVSVGKKIQIN